MLARDNGVGAARHRAGCGARLATVLLLAAGCGGDGLVPNFPEGGAPQLADLSAAVDLADGDAAPDLAVTLPDLMPAERCRPQMDNCPAGTYCGVIAGGVHDCLPGCKGDAECAAGSDAGAGAACCAHRCVDTSVSTSSCGACGKACAPGAVCCAGVCADLDNDVTDCGACGHACSFPNAVAACVGGACFYRCINGFLDCNGQRADGCELDGSNDLKNCGACGTVCSLPNAIAACVVSTCVVSMCNPGWDNCNNLANDGCELLVDSDPLNCGVCRRACMPPLPNVNPVCVKGVCGAAGCAPDFADCDKLPQNGCEVDLTSDDKNCGACGVVCPMNTPACQKSVCVLPRIKLGNPVDEMGFNAATFGGSRMLSFTVTVPAAADLLNFGFFPAFNNKGNVVMALYDDLNNAPSTLVAATASTAIGLPGREQEMPPLKPVRLSAGTYWLAFTTDNSFFVPASGNRWTDYFEATFAYGPAPPAYPVGGGKFRENRSWDFYITVQ